MQENNVLIAEFMGFTFEKNIGWYDNDMFMQQIVYDNEGGNCFDELKFHQDWNWLMAVVDKIETLNYDFQIMGGCWVIIKDIDPCRNEYEEIIEISSPTKIKTVYSAVVEFIKWFNENK